MKKIIFFLLAALALFSCAVTEPEPASTNTEEEKVSTLRNGLVAEYLMGTSSLDSSGKGNHGFLFGPSATTSRLSQVEEAYQFDGINDYIKVGNHPSLHSDKGLTISGWVNLNSNDGKAQCLIWKGDALSPGSREYSIWILENSYVHFNSTSVDSTAQIVCDSAKSVVVPGKWLHFVGIIDTVNDRMAVYVNGKLSHEASYGLSNIKTSDGPLLLGRGGPSSSEYLNGKLDDIRIYNRALSDSEIDELYKLDKAEPAPAGSDIPQDGLMAEYLMDKEASDSSENSNDGLIYGALESSSRFGEANGAYLFDGRDDYIEIKNHPTLHSDRELTISGWMYINSMPTKDDMWQHIFWKADQGQDSFDSTYYTHREYGLALNSDGYLTFSSTPASNNITQIFRVDTTHGVISAGSWNHFVVIVNSNEGKMYLYVNGVLYTPTDYTNDNIKTSNGPLLLGNAVGEHGKKLNGKLDDFRIYNRALTESEVKALYRAK